MSDVIHVFDAPALVRFPSGSVWLIDPTAAHQGPMKHPEGTKIVVVPCVADFREWCADNRVQISLLPSGPSNGVQQVRPDDEHAAMALKLRWL